MKPKIDVICRFKQPLQLPSVPGDGKGYGFATLNGIDNEIRKLEEYQSGPHTTSVYYVPHTLDRLEPKIRLQGSEQADNREGAVICAQDGTPLAADWYTRGQDGSWIDQARFTSPTGFVRVRAWCWAGVFRLSLYRYTLIADERPLVYVTEHELLRGDRYPLGSLPRVEVVCERCGRQVTFRQEAHESNGSICHGALKVVDFEWPGLQGLEEFKPASLAAMQKVVCRGICPHAHFMAQPASVS